MRMVMADSDHRCVLRGSQTPMEQRGEATPREQRSKKAGPQPRGASDPQLLSVAGGG